MKPVLLLVDLQNDFLSAPGLEPEPGEIVRRAARLLGGARQRRVPVIHAVTTVEPEGDDRMPHWKASDRWKCVRGTRGHAAPAELAAQPGEPVVSKNFFSAFSAEAIAAALAATGADTLLVAGVHLHGCVRATVLDAYQRGFTVWIAEDAAGSDDPLHAAVTRRYLEGRAARFAPVEELLARLSGEADGLFLAHRSPRHTAEILFQVPLSGAGDAAKAAAAAREAGESWRRVSPSERARRLACLAERLDGEAQPIAREIAVDVGKPISQAEAEVRRAAELARQAAAARAGNVERSGPDSAFRRVPPGVVVAVTPFNNPVAIPWGKLAPALCLGNTVVWKPAPPATRLAFRMLELAREAGIPEGAVNVLTGDHRAALSAMSDPNVDAVSLTGSSMAGWAAQEICARRRIPLQAELGGNNAAIVWEGADLSRAASLVAQGAFAFAGQRCTSNRRAVVQSELFEDFLARLLNAVSSLVWGDPLEPATEVGPLVSAEARERVSASVERAAEGADRIFAPHAERPAAAALMARGSYYPPTVVVGAAHDSAIVQDETFGPVLALERAEGFDEALRLANGVRHGLVASLFSGPGPWREQFERDAQAGILKWNASTADADAFAPFGGWKASGVGPPEHGPGDAEFYGRLQAIYGGVAP